MSAEKKSSKGFIVMLVAIIVCACFALAAVITAGVSLSKPETTHEWLMWGESGPDDSKGQNGDYYINQTDGYVYRKVDGKWQKTTLCLKGNDGVTPQIKDGYWYFGNENTGVRAEIKVEIKSDGYWYINDQKSEYKAFAELTINDEGYWCVDGEPVGKAYGSVWHTEKGEPDSSLGAVGDYYLDLDTYDIYKKEHVDSADKWTLKGNIKGVDGKPGDPGQPGTPGTPGADGTVWYNGKVAPSAADGELKASLDAANSGDFYLNTVDGKLYRKNAEGDWDEVCTIIGKDGEADRGTQWYSDTFDPNTTTVTGSQAGDFYLKTDDGVLYKKNATGRWEIVCTIKGEVVKGTQWFSDTLDPNSTTVEGSNEGDFYLKTDDGKLYRKNAGGNWDEVCTIIGADGTLWYSGNGNPNDTADFGSEGDYYFDDENRIVYRKTSSGWDNIADLNPTRGSMWYTGEVEPQDNQSLPSDVQEGDMYLDTNKFNVYRYEEGSWAFKANIRGAAGATPTIGDDGYWYIDGKKTDAKAKAEDGKTPYIGENGNWFIDGVDQNKPATGANGVTPQIKDGYWYLGEDNTNVKAVGTVWHSGEGIPTTNSEQDGVDGQHYTGETVYNGDFYIDTVTGKVYVLKGDAATGEWSEIMKLKYTLENRHGAWYLDGNDTGLYVTKWTVGIGDPNGKVAGNHGDLYLDSETGDIYTNATPYANDATMEWNKEKFSLKGPQGKRGSKWFSGQGQPVATEEEDVDDEHYYVADVTDGDMYLDTVSGKIYQFKEKENTWQYLFATKGEKGDKGDPGSKWYNGTADPNDVNVDGAIVGDYYFETQHGYIYVLTEIGADGKQHWDRINENNPVVGTKWLSGPVDPDKVTETEYPELKAKLDKANDYDVYFNTVDRTIWQLTPQSGADSEWVLLGNLTTEDRGTMWYYGTYDPYSKDPAEQAAFEALVAGSINGDFYLQTYYPFTGYTGFRMYALQGSIWTLIVDMRQTAPTNTEYEIPNYDALRAFRDSVNGNNGNEANDYSGKTVTLTGIINIPDETFEPIGTEDHPFKGTFGGNSDQDKLIGNVNGTLFGYLDNATIQNLALNMNLDELSLSTFNTGRVGDYNSLLTNTFGLAKNMDNCHIKNVTLTFNGIDATVVITWGEHENVNVTVTGNTKTNLLSADSYALVLDGVKLFLGKADFTFDNVKFTGETYIDVSVAKSLTLKNCYVDVDPVEACERDEYGVPVTELSGELQGLVGKDRSGCASFIVSRESSKDRDYPLALTVKDSTILSAQSNAGNDSAVYGRQRYSDKDSMAIYINTKLSKAEITGNTFGDTSDGERYTAMAAKFMSFAEDAIIDIKDNIVYGVNDNGFNAFGFSSTNENEYTATFGGNTVEIKKNDETKEAGIVKVEAGENGGKGKFYLLGNENSLNGQKEMLFNAVNCEDDSAFALVAINASLTEDESKITGGYVYIGDAFGANHTNFTPSELEAITDADHYGNVLIVDLAFEDPLGFVQHVNDYETTYYVRNANGLGYFRDMVNGINAYKDKTAPNFNDKTVVQTEDITITESEWTPIGTADKPFVGTFTAEYNDEQHTISGLTINSSINNAGLFGYVDGATIQNVVIENVSITVGSVETEDTYGVGALAGVVKDATVKNITVTGSVTGAYNVGGLIGVTSGNTGIAGALVKVNVTKTDTTDVAHARSIGVLVGAADGTLNVGGVYTSDFGVGSTTVLDNQYEDGKLNYIVYNYGLVGSVLSGETFATDSWANGKNVLAAATVKIDSGLATTPSTGAFNAHITATDLDLAATFLNGTVELGKEYGVVVTVKSKDGLNSIAELVSGGITFKGERIILGNTINMYDNSWKGIGDETHAFEGTFEDMLGAYSINGLYGALFGNLNGTVDGITLNDSVVQTKGVLADKVGTSAEIKSVKINAWVQYAGGRGAVSVSDYAAAPFGFYTEGTEVKVTNSNITVEFYNGSGNVYLTFIAAIDAEGSADVTFKGDNVTSDEYTAVVSDEAFKLGGFTFTENSKKPTASFTFKGIRFEGNSYIDMTELTANLTIENIYAEVTSDNFITDSRERTAKDFVLRNSTIIDVGEKLARAVYSWRYFEEVTIEGNTFGSLEHPYYNHAIKLMGNAAGAVYNINNNTAFVDGSRDKDGHPVYAFDLYQNTSSKNSYTAYLEGNTVTRVGEEGSAGFMRVRTDAKTGGKAQVYLLGEGNKYNDATITWRDIVTTGDFGSFVGYNVSLGEDKKITAGHFIYSDSWKAAANEMGANGLYDSQLRELVQEGCEANVWVERGDGTKYNLEFDPFTVIIQTVDELKEFRDAVNDGNTFEDLTVVLWRENETRGDDGELVFSGSEGIFDLSGSDWTPIGTATAPFKGTFDGRGYTISNLNHANTNTALDCYIGLFGFVQDATLKNVTFAGSNTVWPNVKPIGTIKRNDSGLLVGRAVSSEIDNIKITGTLQVGGGFGQTTSVLGGVAGSSNGSKFTNITIDIDNSEYGLASSVGSEVGKVNGGVVGMSVGDTFDGIQTNATVSANYAAGGVVGHASGSKFTNVNVEADIILSDLEDISEDYYHIGIGGIAGTTWDTDPTFDDVHFTGRLIRKRNGSVSYLNYGLVGGKYGENISLVGNVIKNSSSVVEFADGFQLHAKWGDANSVTAAYEVSSKEGLISFGKVVNEGLTIGDNPSNTYGYSVYDFAKDVSVVLTNNIELNNDNWTPIGTNDNKFRGTFDGQGKTIYNLNVDLGEDGNYGGLFGIASDSTRLKNVTIKGANIKGKEYLGALAGQVYTGGIENINVEGVNITGNHWVGGVVGHGYAYIHNCSVKDANITATPNKSGEGFDNGDKVGGIVGWNNDSAGSDKIVGNTVENVTLKGYRDIGGIVGYSKNADIHGNTVRGVNITVDQITNEYGDKATNAGYIVGREDGGLDRHVLINANNTIETEGFEYSLTYNIKGSEALQTALDEATEYGPTTINLAAGTYTGTSNVDINNKKFTGLTILGYARTALNSGKTYTRTINGLTIQPMEGAEVKFGTSLVMFDTVASHDGLDYLTCLNVNDLTVKGITFEDVSYPIYFYSTNGNSRWDSITFEENNISWTTAATKLDETKVAITVYSENGAVADGQHEWINTNVTINGNTIKNADRPAYLHDLSGLEFTNNTIDGYYFYAVGLQGEAMGGQVVIRGNKFMDGDNITERNEGLLRGNILYGDLIFENNEIYGITANKDTLANNSQILISFENGVKGHIETSGNKWFAADDLESAVDKSIYGIVETNEELTTGANESGKLYRFHLELAIGTLENTTDGLAGLKTFREDVNSGKCSAYFTSALPIKLTDNIDLGNEEWTPIGVGSNSFGGTFDGQNFTISNLQIISADHDGLGLFGSVHGTLKNFIIKNVNIIAPERSYIGGAVGSINGYIENVHVTGYIHLEGKDFVAAVAGYGYANFSNISAIKTAEAPATIALAPDSFKGIQFDIIASGESAGGLIGYIGESNGYKASNLTVGGLNVYAHKAAGGAIGNINVNVTVDDVHVSGVHVAADNNTAGIILGTTQSGDKLTNYEWLESAVWKWNSNKDEGIWYDESDASVVAPLDWDENSVKPGDVASENERINRVWLDEKLAVSKTDTGLVKIYKGTDAEGLAIRYEVTSAAGLAVLAKAQNAGLIQADNFVDGNIVIELTQDIDMTSATDFEPIGNEAHPFVGEFNGASFKISNITITREDDNVGLFGVIGDKAVITNLTLDTVNVSGANCVGALVGKTQDGKEAHIFGITVKNVTINGTNNVGGVVGSLNGTTVLENVDIVTVTVKGAEAVGGVAGGYFPSVWVKNVNVSGIIKIDGNYKVGGVIGGGYGNIQNATVDGGDKAQSYVKATYSKEDLEGDNVGGIIGYTGEGDTYVYDSLTVKNITVSGTRKVGGVVGYYNRANNTDREASGFHITNVTVENANITNKETSNDYALSKAESLFVGAVVGEFASSICGGIEGVTLNNVTVNAFFFYATGKQSGTEACEVVGGSRSSGATLNITGVTKDNVTINAGVQVDKASDGRLREVSVYTPAQLIYINDNAATFAPASGANDRHFIVKIMDDIDFDAQGGQIEWTGKFPHWTDIQGNNHVISGIQLTPDSEGRAGFVSTYGGDIWVNDLILADVSGEGTQIGVFFGNEENVHLNNCRVQGTINLTYNSYYNSDEKCSGIGVFAGIDQNMEFVNCSVDEGCEVTLDASTINSEFVPTENYLTGFAREAKGNLSCTVSGKITVILANKTRYLPNEAGINFALQNDKGEIEYAVYSAGGLKFFRDQINEGVRFDKDVVLESDIDIIGEQWVPIGTNTHPFYGTFDGKGHVISGLNVNGEYDTAGLFGSASKFGGSDGRADIKNFTLSDVTVVNTKGSAGAVVGAHVDGSLNGITVSGNIHVEGVKHAGGIVGLAYCDLVDLKVIGSNLAVAAIADTYSFNIIAHAAANGNAIVGGIAGGVGETATLDLRNLVVRNVSILADKATNTGVGEYAGGIFGTAPEASGRTASGIEVSDVKVGSTETSENIGVLMGFNGGTKATEIIYNNNAIIDENGSVQSDAEGELEENDNAPLYGSSTSSELVPGAEERVTTYDLVDGGLKLYVKGYETEAQKLYKAEIFTSEGFMAWDKLANGQEVGGG